MKVKEHYNKNAKKYSKGRTKGLIGSVVLEERKAVLSFLDVKKGDNILDAGCGSGDYANLIKERGGIPFGVDVSQNMIDIIKTRGFKGEVADLDTLNLGKTFDKVVCAGVLEFTNNPTLAIKNLKNHLKKDGFIVLLATRKNIGGGILKLYHLIHGINIHLFSLEDLKRISSLNNLKITDLKKTKICNLVKITNKHL